MLMQLYVLVMCMDWITKELKEKGFGREDVAAAVRVASTESSVVFLMNDGTSLWMGGDTEDFFLAMSAWDKRPPLITIDISDRGQKCEEIEEEAYEKLQKTGIAQEHARELAKIMMRTIKGERFGKLLAHAVAEIGGD